MNEDNKPPTDEVTLIVSTAGLPTPEQIEAMLRGMLTGPIADIVRDREEHIPLDWAQQQARARRGRSREAREP